MGRKLLYVTIVATLLVGTTLGASDAVSNQHELVKKVCFRLSEPEIKDHGKYVIVELKEQTSFFMIPGKPIIPTITKVFTFPVGTKICEVKVFMESNTYNLPKRLQPSPKPVILSVENLGETEEIIPDESIYNSNQPYPANPYETKTGVGILDGKRVVFLTVHCYAQYKPLDNTITVPSDIEIVVKYEAPEKPLLTADKYDMVIITDEKFVPYLRPLVDHKNNIGIRTFVETTKEIYNNYEGRDNPEKIKYFIKDAIEKYGIKYVLLFGGRKGQTFDWYIPERRSNNNADMESGYATDLYYADIYRCDEYGRLVFDDWDSNKNGKFAEANGPDIIDVIDYYPDVYLGRIPVCYTWEAEVVIDKIINYELGTSPSWFKRAFMISGDTFPPSRGGELAIRGVYEGEIVANVAARYLEEAGFEVYKLYTSLGNFTNYEDVVNAMNQGSGFVYMGGHGNPGVWGNFLPDAETEEEFALGFTVFDIWKYANGYKLPVVVVGGCHNAQFNVTMQNLLRYGLSKYGESYPHDGCSWMLLEEDGGSIASIGYTGYGYGYINFGCTYGLGGWLEPRFFHAYAVQGKERLGEVFAQAIIDYLNIIDNVNVDGGEIDRKTIESWELLGDPSLKIGGTGDHLCNMEPESKDSRDFQIVEDVVPPKWNVGTTWVYRLSHIDFTLDQIEGRYIDFHFGTGEIRMEVLEVTSSEYKVGVTIDDVSISINATISLFEENPVEPFTNLPDPIVAKGALSNASVTGEITIDREKMGIKSGHFLIRFDLIDNLDELGFKLELPPILWSVLKYIKIPVNIEVEIGFEEPFVILDFPLKLNKTWATPQANVTVDIGGIIASPWLRLLHIFDKIAGIFGIHIVPPELAKYLPVINISEFLEDQGIPTHSEFQIPGLWDPLYHDIHLFKCKSRKRIEVVAGNFDTCYISMVRGIGEVYYSPDAGNIVKIQGNFGDILPIVKNVNLELIELEKP